MRDTAGWPKQRSIPSQPGEVDLRSNNVNYPQVENRESGKLAILYTLYRNDQVLGEGRLKIQFGKIVW